MTFKKLIVYILILTIAIGLLGCSETSKNQKENQENNIKKDNNNTSYKEHIIKFEDDRAYGSFEMKSNDNGNVEYITLEQEQLTDKPISQSYSHEFTGDEWKSKKTKWGGLLKDQLEKQVDLKKRIYETNLSIAADGKLYVTYNFFHPDVILDTKGSNYEYIVSNLLFCINLESNEVVQIKIPDASKCNSNDGVNPLKCSAFADGKLLIQDGEKTYIYNHITGETVCSVETVQNASNYIPGDDFLYSVQAESNGKFNICEYNENDGKVNRKIPLKLRDAETMQNTKKIN